MHKVLVTGGCGYIGSVLTRLLLNEGYEVCVLDNLSFGGDSIVELMNHKRFSFIKGDVRSEKDVLLALEGVQSVVHLAAIVGDPACAKAPDLSKSINIGGSQLLYKLANEKEVSHFIFASTCSNYGKMKDTYVDESSELSPVSLYAETKVDVEKFLLSQKNKATCVPTCLRFSTVYGLSPRLRFDLTVNEFTKELALSRELVVFGENFWRPYCHVVDLSRSVIAALEAPKEKVAFEVFNVGDTTENYQKRGIVSEITKYLPESRIKYVEKKEDPRDYRVSFEKIKETIGFQITKTVPDGIQQVLRVIQEGWINDPDDKKYRNV